MIAQATDVDGPGRAQAPADRRSGIYDDWCLLDFTRNGSTNVVRRAQVDALIRFTPVNIVVNMSNAVVVAIAVHDHVPAYQWQLWLGVLILLCGGQLARAAGLFYVPAYARRKPATPVTICRAILVISLVWMVAPLLWFDNIPADDQLIMVIVLSVMMCGASVTLATVPLASIWFNSVITVAMMVNGTDHHHHLVHWAIWVTFDIVLATAVMWNVRQFVGHQHARIEIGEKEQVISLLREFEASGSEWLWEVDTDDRIVYMSRDMAEQSGRDIGDFTGVALFSILDPDGHVRRGSTGMRSLSSHLKSFESFRDIAVPTPSGRWWSLSGKPLIDRNGAHSGWRGVGSDVTAVRLSGNNSVRAARRDPLTGLGNRLLISEQLEEMMLQSPDKTYALMLLDLDRFKVVNDTLGHAVGDRLLQEVATRLAASVSPSTIVGRLGGDEFAVIVPAAGDPGKLGQLATLLTTTLSQPFKIAGNELCIGATIGIALSVEGASQDELFRRADLALYSAKQKARGGQSFYEPWMTERANEYRQLETDLRRALEAGGLSLAYQPIVATRDSCVIGYEALLRWNHPDRGDVPPAVFVPIIEDIGLIHQIGGWAIREACNEAARWDNHRRIAVNVSAVQIAGGQLTVTVISALAESGLAPERLELEVTESIFLGEDPATLGTLTALRSLGVRLVIDDFGKGYSSFGYLARARFAKIKIDQVFVQGAAAGNADYIAIVESIVSLARGMSIETTAEGIETAKEEKVMRALGCDQLQGFCFGHPLPAAAFATDAAPPLRRLA